MWSDKCNNVPGQIYDGRWNQLKNLSMTVCGTESGKTEKTDIKTTRLKNILFHQEHMWHSKQNEAELHGRNSPNCLN